MHKQYKKLRLLRILGSSSGCFLAIGFIAYLTASTGALFIMPPFGATCVIAFVIPDSAFAQPRSIICGHFLSSLIGILCVSYLGTDWWSYPVAVALSAALMQLTRALHPPAAADPILVLMQQTASLDFLMEPVLLGSGILVLLAMIHNNLIAHREYPKGIYLWFSSLLHWLNWQHGKDQIRH